MVSQWNSSGISSQDSPQCSSAAKSKSSILEASVFMGKNYSDNLHSANNTAKDLTLKQLFDISEKLIAGQSDEICGTSTDNLDDSSWKHFSLIGDEEVISLSHPKVYLFSDSVLCPGKMNENPQSNTVWEDKLTWFKSSSQYIAKGQNNLQDGSSSCRCSTTSHGDLKTMNRNAN